jgi:hypothetical protein
MKSKLDKLFEHPEMKEFLKHAEEEMFPNMEGSSMCMSFVTDKPDAKLAIELGACLLFDKPLILVVSKGMAVPARLLRLADAVIDLDDWQKNPEKARATVARAITQVRTRFPKGTRT